MLAGTGRESRMSTELVPLWKGLTASEVEKTVCSQSGSNILHLTESMSRPIENESMGTVFRGLKQTRIGSHVRLTKTFLQAPFRLMNSV